MPDEPRSLGEFERIRRLTAHLPEGRGVIVGPGDDAAVVRPSDGMDLVITTDSFVEGRHFQKTWARDASALETLAQAIGRRLAAANLSDVAAMAAVPRWAVVSFGLNAGDPTWIESLERAAAAKLGEAGAAVVGGNLARVEGAEWYDLTLIGEVERGRAWTRRGARAGDWIAVTGAPGTAAAFEALAMEHFAGRASERSRALAALWSDPPARNAAARALAATGGVTAAIDISDGLSGDLAHLCEAGGVGAEIDEDALRSAAAPEGCFVPSDDYELLLAVDPAKRDACADAAQGSGAALAFIGRVTSGRELRLRQNGGAVVPLPGHGYDHFA